MPLLLGQLVYTSFPKVGFRALASPQVPTEIQQAFIQQVVYQHWDSYNPPRYGYRAAYLHQVTLEDTLFGWVYNDGLDELGRSHVPYFVCYYLAGLLDTVQLEKIFTCLHKGPLALIDRQRLPATLESIVTPDLLSYQPACIGVAIPSSVRERSHLTLKHKSLLDIFVPVDEREEDVKQIKPLNAATVANTAKTPAFSGTAPSQGMRSQMTKIALLIGVSDYESGFKSLPKAQKDVAAMQQILQHPEIGSFTEVRVLLNPDRQVMEEAIETLFSERQRDDIVLLYFSGHGIKDDSGKLYLTTSISRLNVQEKLVKSSAVLASFVQEMMSDSRSQHQFVILECCFSDLTEDSLDSNDISEDIWHQLGGKGRVILTSSSSTQSGFVEQNSSDLSVYTRYLVEGMETGAADLNHDGVILIEEWHDYSSRKVQIAIPAIQPRIYGLEDQHQIILAKAAIDDPKRRYRQEVERYAHYGEISIVSRSILDVLRDTLGLLPEEAAAIEAAVLAPYREYHQKLQRYAQGFVAAIHQESPLGATRSQRCQHLQLSLGLREQDVAPIEAEIAREITALASQADNVGSSREVQTPLPEELTPVNLLNSAAAARETAATAPGETEFYPQRFSKKNSSTISSSNSNHPNFVTVARNSRLLIGTSIVMGLAVGIGVLYAYIQLLEIRTLKTDAKYDDCINKAKLESWAAETVFYNDTQRLVNECQLEQAKTLAAGENFLAAIAAAEKIPENSPLYPEAQKLIKEWSEI